MWLLEPLIAAFMVLVQIARLILRHTVREGDIPLCAQKLIKDDSIEYESVEWQQLYFFGITDGVIQFFDANGDRVLVAWVCMGEPFRIVHFGENQCIKKYELTVATFIWEPLLAQRGLIDELQRSLHVDTSLGDYASKTIKLTRGLTGPTTLKETRTIRCRRPHSLEPECFTVKRIYKHYRDDLYQIHKSISWNGYPEQKPRLETEIEYNNKKVIKKVTRTVNENDLARSDSSVAPFNDISSTTITQMYDETHHFGEYHRGQQQQLRRRACRDRTYPKVYNTELKKKNENK